MRKILVIRGVSSYDVLGRAADEICRGFRNCGYEVDMIDSVDIDSENQLMECLEHIEDYEFYFSIQAILWNLEPYKFQELQKIKRVGWIVDDPVYHQKRLLGSTGQDAYVLIVRDSHAREIRQEFPKFERVAALYHGGFQSERKIAYCDKDIEVFFPGTYTSLKDSEEKVNAIEGVFGQIARNVKGRIIGTNLASSWTEELRDYLKEIDVAVDEDEFLAMKRVLYPLDQYQRDYMRQRVIENLLVHGIKVSVVGTGWENYDGAGKEKLEILSSEGVGIEEVIVLMQRSKIVLNNTNILDGMHERIFTAMLAGAVCVTNEYELLDELLENEKELVTFPLNHLECLPDIIKDLLEHPDKAERIAKAGYQAAVDKHTWERRGEQIIKWLENGRDFTYERLCDISKSSI